MTPPEEVANRLKDLADERWYVRRAAAKKLACESPPDALPALLNALQDEDPGVRLFTCLALAQLKDPRAAEPIAALLEDSRKVVRSLAMEVLVHLHNPKSPAGTAFLIARANMHQYSDYQSRGWLMVVLGDDLVEALCALPKPTDWRLRQTLVYILGVLRNPKAAPTFAEYLHDEEPFVRFHAAWGLGRIQSQDVIEPLLAVLHDQDYRVQQHAMNALQSWRTPRAIEAFCSLSQDANAETRHAARLALQEIAPEPKLARAALLCDQMTGAQRLAALKALYQCRIGQWRSRDPYIAIRRFCQDALTQPGAEEGVALVLEALAISSLLRSSSSEELHRETLVRPAERTAETPPEELLRAATQSDPPAERTRWRIPWRRGE